MAVAREKFELLGADAYQLLFESAPTPLALIASAVPFRLAAANEAFEQLMGLARGAGVGRRLDAVFRAAAALQLQHAVETTFEDGEAIRLRIAHAAQSRVLRVEVEVRRILVGADLYALVSLTVLDRRLTLSELGEAGVLAELGALSRGLVYIQDVDREFIRYGRHPLVAKLGLPRGVLKVDAVRLMVHPDDRAAWEDWHLGQSAAPDDRVTTLTFRMLGADGECMWINVRSRVFTRGRDGEVHRVIGVATDVTEIHMHAAAMQDAAEALSHAEANERQRIGRELHDSTSQLLVAARLGLGAVERRSELTPAAQHALDEVRQSIIGAQAEIRNFSYMLHPPSLQSEGLIRCLRHFAEGFSRRTGLTIAVRIGRGIRRLPMLLELALYRITQEALMNVYRHAEAHRARVGLRQIDGRLILEIEDDGVGLQMPASRLEGVGVSGMQARMTQLGGTLVLEPGRRGLRVRASVPLSVAVET